MISNGKFSIVMLVFGGVSSSEAMVFGLHICNPWLWVSCSMQVAPVFSNFCWATRGKALNQQLCNFGKTVERKGKSARLCRGMLTHPKL